MTGWRYKKCLCWDKSVARKFTFAESLRPKQYEGLKLNAICSLTQLFRLSLVTVAWQVFCRFVFIYWFGQNVVVFFFSSLHVHINTPHIKIFCVPRPGMWTQFLQKFGVTCFWSILLDLWLYKLQHTNNFSLVDTSHSEFYNQDKFPGKFQCLCSYKLSWFHWALYRRTAEY